MAASDSVDQIQQFYVAYLGRPADPAGLTYWANQLDATNGNVQGIIAGFASSPEANALSAGMSTSQQISSIYLTLFNRVPETEGLAYWVSQVENGALTQAQLPYLLMSAASTSDASAVANKLSVAKLFTAQIDTPAETSGYNDAVSLAYGRAFLTSVDATSASVTSATSNLTTAVATATGTTPAGPVTQPTPTDTTYTLTTNIETLTAGATNDTFIATIDTDAPGLSTFTKGDSLDGGSGTDTLSLTVTGSAGGSWPATTVTNIEQLLIRDQHKGGSVSTYELLGVTGLSTVASNVSTAAVTFSNVQTGTTVAMLGNKANTLGALSFTMSKTTDAINLLLDGGVKTTSISSSIAQARTVTISSTGVANQVGVIDLGESNSVSKLVIKASANLTTTLSSDDYASTATLTLTGSGKVDLGTTLGFSGSYVDASASKGGLTIVLSGNTQSFVGSNGADRVLGAATIANTSSIDGGFGTDTVSATLINSGNAAEFKNFELLDLAGTANSGSLDVAQLINSTVTGVVISGQSTGTYTLSNLEESTSGFNVDVTGSTAGSFLTLGFAADSVSGSSDVLNYTFNNLAGTATDAGSVRSENIEEINISSGGLTTGNALRIVDNETKSIVITGDQALNLTVAAQSGSGASPLSSIDGSAATGALTINTAASVATGGQTALAIKTGSGNDTITATTSAIAGSVGSTITTGTGADKVDLTAATVNTIANIQLTTITDLGVGDSLAFGSSLTFNAAEFVPVTPGDLESALTQASSGLSSNSARWFKYSDNTYIIDNVDGIDGVGATDIVVKLTGTVDLTAWTAVAGTLTFTPMA